MSYRPDDEALGFLITDTARLLRAEFDRAIAAESLGTTPGEARALSHVARACPVRQAALAERMGVEAMTLSTYLDRLQSLGFIERRPDPADRRAKLIHTTPAAADIITSIRIEQIELMQLVTSGIGEEDLALMRERMKRLRANLAALEEDSAALALAKETGR